MNECKPLLPGPPQETEHLVGRAVQVLAAWCDRFGVHYPRLGLADVARRVIPVGCLSCKERRVVNTLDDVAGNICQALTRGWG